jgi:hypothetical protein
MYQLPYELEMQILENIDDYQSLDNFVTTDEKILDKNKTVSDIICRNQSINEAFRYSIKSNYIEGVKKYSNVKMTLKNECLMYSVCNGNESIVEYLLEHCDDPTEFDIYKAIQYAVISNYIDIAKYIINIADERNIASTLNWIATENHVCILQYVIDVIKLKNFGLQRELNRALVSSAEYGFLNIFEYLFENGNISICLERLLIASIEFGQILITKYLVKHGAKITNNILHQVGIHNMTVEQYLVSLKLN